MSAPEAPKKPAGGKWRKGQSGNPGGKKRVVAQPAAPQPTAPQPEDAQPENSGRNPDGTFAKGNAVNLAGKPKGTRHKATMLAEALLDGQAQALMQQAVSMALGGDPQSLRICIERILAARRDRPIEISLPKIAAASDLVAAAAALTDAVAGGDITPSEASALSNLVGNTAKAIETFELSERLARLEEQMAAKGSNP
jgi:hypothetical protein